MLEKLSPAHRELLAESITALAAALAAPATDHTDPATLTYHTTGYSVSIDTDDEGMPRVVITRE